MKIALNCCVHSPKLNWSFIGPAAELTWIDALVIVGRELGGLTGVQTPVIDAVLALVQERGRAVGLYAQLS
jgi:hypothetical protein